MRVLKGLIRYRCKNILSKKEGITVKQLLIISVLAIIFFSPEILRFFGRIITNHWLTSAKKIKDDPPANDMHLEILVRNKYTHNWIKASAGIVLLRPNEYDLWMPK